MTSSQLDFLQEKQYQLYELMRPDAIAYVDAFDLWDPSPCIGFASWPTDVY